MLGFWQLSSHTTPPQVDPAVDARLHAWIVGCIPGEEGDRKWEYLSEGFSSTIDDPIRHSYLPEVAVHGVVEDTVEVIAPGCGCLVRGRHRFGRGVPPRSISPQL